MADTGKDREQHRRGLILNEIRPAEDPVKLSVQVSRVTSLASLEHAKNRMYSLARLLHLEHKG